MGRGTSFMARQHGGALIPVLLDKIRRPLLLEDIQHIDAHHRECRAVAEEIADALHNRGRVRHEAALHMVRSRHPRLDRSLPYTSNRSQQKRVLKEAFRAAAGQGVPLVWIVPGEQPRQSLHTFVAIAWERLLLPFYGESAKGADATPFSYRWAAEEDRTDRRLDLLRENLAKGLGAPEDSIEAIGRVIANQPVPVMVETEIYARQWRRNEPDLLRNWIRFWADESLKPRIKPLQVAIKVHLDPSGSKFWSNIHRRRRRKGIVSFLEHIAATSFDGVKVVVLPELPSVSLSEALRWVDQAVRWFEVQGFQSALVREHLEEKINKLFQNATLLDPDRRIPMKTLAIRLENLIHNYRQEINA